MSDEYVEIEGEVRDETELAWKFYDGTQTVWLPKSQTHWDEDDRVMSVPEWLALKEGLI